MRSRALVVQPRAVEHSRARVAPGGQVQPQPEPTLLQDSRRAPQPQRRPVSTLYVGLCVGVCVCVPVFSTSACVFVWGGGAGLAHCRSSPLVLGRTRCCCRIRRRARAVEELCCAGVGDGDGAGTGDGADFFELVASSCLRRPPRPFRRFSPDPDSPPAPAPRTPRSFLRPQPEAVSTPRLRLLDAQRSQNLCGLTGIVSRR